MEEDSERIRYSCVVGHEIPAENLESATEMKVLDQGAVVRLCREHGAPIAMHRPARRPAASDE